MAQEVILPKQGQSVETCRILSWKKKVGEQVREGEELVEVETDKAAFEIPSPASGTLLKILHAEGEDVPVLSALAWIGKPGEAVGEAPPAGAAGAAAGTAPAAAPTPASAYAGPASMEAQAAAAAAGRIPISPRARRLAERSGLSPAEAAAALAGGRGSGPGGRILERDVAGILGSRAGRSVEAITAPAAARAGAQGAAVVGPEPAAASPARPAAAAFGPAPAAPPAVRPEAEYPGPVTEIPVKGVRKIIAERMLASLAATAQYTLHTYAEAEMLTAYRSRLKDSPEELGLRSITIGDLVNFAVVRLLARHPEVNALFQDGRIRQFQRVHLAFAVDTPRGLLVPVIRSADLLTLKQLSAETARLRQACLEGRAAPDELAGGTFTVTNLGALGVEHFTPVLNPPQVAILGVGGIALRPVPSQKEEEHCPVVFKRHIALSLTANHQVLDGAPAARFLAELRQSIENIGLVLAG